MLYNIINANGRQLVNRINRPESQLLGTVNRAISLAKVPGIPGVPNLRTLPAVPAVLPTGMGSSQSDVVGVYTSAYRQIIMGARPIVAQVAPVAMPFDHPLESGGVATDWRVILPTEVTLNVYLTPAEYRATYAAIEALFVGTELFIVQTLVATWKNMMLVAMPHDEDGSTSDLIAMQLRFRQVTLIKAQFQAMGPQQTAAPADQSTVKKGDVQPKGASLAFRGVTAIGGLPGAPGALGTAKDQALTSAKAAADSATTKVKQYAPTN